ncbi:hypothetical protein D915_006228 [Fasciola hepatica]|uniref:Uncharacterized protein n=1 Tax=Fasciola hepatica TaxID=6192 RepID=A0A4E0S033_FASHE|nr:hypothetical protein D915_006228 [Fasciola hepatica]
MALSNKDAHPQSNPQRDPTLGECQATSATHVIWNGVQLELDDISDEDEVAAGKQSRESSNIRTRYSDHQNHLHYHRHHHETERRHYARSPLPVSPFSDGTSPRHGDAGPSQLKEYFLAHGQQRSRPSSENPRHAPRDLAVAHRASLDSNAHNPASVTRYASGSSSEEAYVPGAADVPDFILHPSHSSATRGARRSVCVQEDDSPILRSPQLHPSKHASRERRLEFGESHHSQQQQPQQQSFPRHSGSRHQYSTSDSSRSPDPLASRRHCVSMDPEDAVHHHHHRNQHGSKGSFRGTVRHQHHYNYHAPSGRCQDSDGTKRHDPAQYPQSRTSPDLSLYHNSERLDKPVSVVGGRSYGRPTFVTHHESRLIQVYSDVGSSTPSIGDVSRSSGSLSDSADASSPGAWSQL